MSEERAPPEGTSEQKVERHHVRRLLLKNYSFSGLALLLSVSTMFLFDYVSGTSVDPTPPLYLIAAAALFLPLSFRAMARSAAVLREPARAASDATALRRIFLLPRRLSQIHLGTWIAIGLAAGTALLLVERFRPDRSFMVLLASVLAGIGAALVSLVRSGLELAPVWSGLSAHFTNARQSGPEFRTSLRQKITLVLGGVVFFSSAFGLYSAFAVQREIVTFQVNQQGREVVRAATEAAKKRNNAGWLCRELGRVAPSGGILAYEGDGGSCVYGAEGRTVRIDELLAAGAGSISLPSQDLEGAGYVLPGGRGLLVVLFPKPAWARRVLLVSLLFYTLLFAFSAYLAAQVARELTMPIDDLRQRLKRIETGSLDEPVHSASADEIGELAFSVETMRRGLSEMVETIRSLNLTLEHKVEERTAELQRANREVTSAMLKLKETQSHLVHAEKMASLGRLMSGLAHELNNPVNAIVNSASPLKRGLERSLARGDVGGGGTERLLRAATVVEEAANRTVDLIRSLATFSRQDELVRKEVDINASLRATLMLLQHRIDGATVRLEVREGQLPPCEGAPGELNQVLMNLLANAIEAVEERGGGGHVRVETSTADGFIVVSVDDNGPGVAPEAAQRIFEPFFTTRDQGTGLGLAISHEVVSRHGGTITVEDSTDLAGSRFVLRLPLLIGGSDG